MLGRGPEYLESVDQLKEWATAWIRYGKAAKRWLLIKDERGYYLRHRDTPLRFSRRSASEDRQRLRHKFGELLDRNWPRNDTEGRCLLTPAGVVALLASSAGVKAEGKRLRELDAARDSRTWALEERAERAFEGLERVEILESRSATPGHTCRPGGWGAMDSRLDCPACQTADLARDRARARARAWMAEPSAALDGRTPRDAAEAAQDGLTEALQALEALTAELAASEAA